KAGKLVGGSPFVISEQLLGACFYDFRPASWKRKHLSFTSPIAIRVEFAGRFLVAVPKALFGQQISLCLPIGLTVSLLPCRVQRIVGPLHPRAATLRPSGVCAIGLLNAFVVDRVRIRMHRLQQESQCQKETFHRAQPRSDRSFCIRTRIWSGIYRER